MENIEKPTPIYLLIVIANKGKGKIVTKIFNEVESKVQIATFGYGTASKILYDYLGVGETVKDVVFRILPDEQIKETMDRLDAQLNLEKSNSGIAFTIPIQSIASMQMLKYVVDGGKS